MYLKAQRSALNLVSMLILFCQAWIEPEHHPNKNIRGLSNDLTDWPYGEMGIGVTLVPEAMSAKEAAKRTSMYKNHAFEEYVSELISLDRY